jgi:hypothetical protein
MFIIFGWNHPETTSYGAVEQQLCDRCHNTEYWKLEKISQYFTLFIIPIIKHNSIYRYHYPICNDGQHIDRDTAQLYKQIAKINDSFVKYEIDEAERVQKVAAIHQKISAKQQMVESKNIADSNNWIEKVREKSDRELLSILNEKRSEYSAAFIIAAEAEIKLRGLSAE